MYFVLTSRFFFYCPVCSQFIPYGHKLWMWARFSCILQCDHHLNFRLWTSLKGNFTDFSTSFVLRCHLILCICTVYTLSPFILQKKTFDSQVMYFAQSNIRVDINWYICVQVTWRKTIHCSFWYTTDILTIQSWLNIRKDLFNHYIEGYGQKITYFRKQIKRFEMFWNWINKFLSS